MLTVGVKPWQPRTEGLNSHVTRNTTACTAGRSNRSVGLTDVESTVPEGKGLRGGRTGFASGH